MLWGGVRGVAPRPIADTKPLEAPGASRMWPLWHRNAFRQGRPASHHQRNSIEVSDEELNPLRRGTAVHGGGLQSTNKKEVETSKEEVQSVNEELMRPARPGFPGQDGSAFPGGRRHEEPPGQHHHSQLFFLDRRLCV